MPEETIETKLARIETMANRGLKPAAAQMSRLILEKNPRNIQALVWLARTTTQTDEAEKAARQAALLDPNNPLVRELQATRQTQNQPQTPVGVGAGFNPYSPATGNYAPPGFQDFRPDIAPPSGVAPQMNETRPYGATNGSSYTAPGMPQQPSSYDYLRPLNNSVAQPSLDPYAPASPQPVPVAKANRRTNPANLLFGLLFLVAGLGAAVFWTLQVQDYNSDIAKPTSPLPGQVIELSKSNLKADLKGPEPRSYRIYEGTFNTLAPLIGDAKNNQQLTRNAVVLNVTPGGRLASVEVQSPNKGSAVNNNTQAGLLGYGAAADWGLTALSAILALLGLLLLGRAFTKPRLA